MGTYYVGLDLHSQRTTFVIQDEAGAMVARGAVPTTPDGFARLCQAHQLAAGTTVALETGTSSFYVARLLAELQLTPVVVDAHEVRLKAHRPTQKSDRPDAFELCDGIRRGIYRSLVHVPTPAISQLRTALSRRRHFIRIQTAEINATKRLLRGSGWRVGTPASLRSAGSWDRVSSRRSPRRRSFRITSAAIAPSGSRPVSRSASSIIGWERRPTPGGTRSADSKPCRE
jgi:transposase